MLKKICKLFLGLVVCAGSACVTPTHASSADDLIANSIVISRIQAAGEFGAKDEYIVLHNNSGVELNVTNWCLMNKSNVLFACFGKSYENIVESIYIPPYGDALVASSNFVNSNSYVSSLFAVVYEVTNQSSGSIVNSTDRISLINNEEEVFDVKSWESAIPTNKVLSRVLLFSGPNIYANTNSASDWVYEVKPTLPVNSARVVITEINVSEPDTNLEPDVNEPPVEAGIIANPFITEILANPAGSDTGGEYIELYNPNEKDAVLLDNYALLIGATTPKIHAFPEGFSIPPLSYAVFSNQDMGYSLVNTNGRVQLIKSGENIGEVIEYISPKDDYSWSLVEGVWQYIKPGTPGTTNVSLAIATEDPSNINFVKPCAANQFRNPETGRCKLVATAASVPAPCKENQERNPDTNRCRNIAAAAEPTPCKEGQERNLETNRCRAIVKMSKAGSGVNIQTKADTAMSWYYWAAIVAIVLLILGYAVWEWREELQNTWARIRATLAKHPE